MDKAIHVGMGELEISSHPGKLRTTGLGSCIALIIYDYNLKIGGLAHIMLPSDPGKSNGGTGKFGKYADVAIPYLYNKLIGNGSKNHNLWAKMAGGAQMFAFESTDYTIRIGERNIKEVKKILKELQIPLRGTDIGGNKGRTIEFDLSTGELKIKSFQNEEKII